MDHPSTAVTLLSSTVPFISISITGSHFLKTPFLMIFDEAESRSSAWLRLLSWGEWLEMIFLSGTGQWLLYVWVFSLRKGWKGAGKLKLLGWIDGNDSCLRSSYYWSSFHWPPSSNHEFLSSGLSLRLYPHQWFVTVKYWWVSDTTRQLATTCGQNCCVRLC